MKSLEASFAEALTKLKKLSVSKFNTVFDGCQKLSTIEAKLNAVEAALGTVKESRASATDFVGRMNAVEEELNEARRDCAILFDVEPRARATNNESKPPIRMHNGAIENFVEGSPFNEGRTNTVTENNTGRKDMFAESDKIMADWMLENGKITEAEHRKLTGAKSEAYEKLSEQQRKEFDFARAIGISEADAFKLANLAGSTFREVSRR